MEQEGRIHYYILFENYTQGMMLQSILREEGISSRISPTPHVLQAKAGCGVSLLILPEEIDWAKSCIEKNHAEYYDIVSLPCQINPNRDKFC
jgi:hypothetical protein